MKKMVLIIVGLVLPLLLWADAEQLQEQMALVNTEALERLTAHLSEKYPTKESHLNTLMTEFEQYDLIKIQTSLKKGDSEAWLLAEQLLNLQRRIVLSNPAIDFEKMLLIRRKPIKNNNRGSKYIYGLPTNSHSNSSEKEFGWNSSICLMNIKDASATLIPLLTPEKGGLITDIDLHFNADRMMFSMPDEKDGHFQIYEMNIDGSGLNKLTLIPDSDVENYDSCYLPNGNIIFSSTAPMTGVPCENGNPHVTNLYYYDVITRNIRRLTFDQEHNWGPTVMNDGTVMYLRWEYSDLPHFVARILMTMNPDGTNQRGYYGSNSYWPNSLYFARQLPDNSGRFVGVVSGHHVPGRKGQLVLFDPSKGRFEDEGVVQPIPGYGKKVDPVIEDQVGNKIWPQFVHPYPLDDTTMLVSAQLKENDEFGLYLIDTFDNMVLLKQEAGLALFEPIPLKPHPVPPMIPDRVQPDSATATMFINDVYEGPGLAGVPRGTVKKLRISTYQYAYQGIGGQSQRVGMDGPWDVRRVMGTVDVEKDGSSIFKIPANTPITIQPLDEEGKALQLMRSWTTAMPGEVLSCVGCHESPETAPVPGFRLASRKAPQEIQPWHGPSRGFSFNREVQPVLDKYCVSCHNAEHPLATEQEFQSVSSEHWQTKEITTTQCFVPPEFPNFTTGPELHPFSSDARYAAGARFSASYHSLHRHVRTHTMESDMHLLTPYDFHTDTTELYKMLRQGHHGVELDEEAWDRLITWIDLNAPYHGSWTEVRDDEQMSLQSRRRTELMAAYSTRCDDEDKIILGDEYWPAGKIGPKPVKAPENLSSTRSIRFKEFEEDTAKEMQQKAGSASNLNLSDGLDMKLVPIPKASGSFTMSACEISNQQFAQFDPTHDSRLEHGDFLQFSVKQRGWPLNKPDQPVCRVSWKQADAFCKWLSEKSGKKVRLPTEDEWEWACRAGSSNPMWFGPLNTPFEDYANLADSNLLNMERDWFKLPEAAIAEVRPGDSGQNDGHRVSAPIGSYKPNPWGLYDMHGNVAEWTSSDFDEKRKTVKGGSWFDRPKWATTETRIGYVPWQKVYNVGFRVVIEE